MLAGMGPSLGIGPVASALARHPRSAYSEQMLTHPDGRRATRVERGAIGVIALALIVIALGLLTAVSAVWTWLIVRVLEHLGSGLTLVLQLCLAVAMGAALVAVVATLVFSIWQHPAVRRNL